MAKPDEKITSILHTAIQIVEDADVDVRHFRNGIDTIQDLIHLNCMNCNRYVNNIDESGVESYLIGEYFDLIKNVTFALSHIHNVLPGQEKTEEQFQTDSLIDQVDEMIDESKQDPPEKEVKFGSKIPQENEHTREVDSQMRGIDKLSKEVVLSKNARRQ